MRLQQEVVRRVWDEARSRGQEPHVAQFPEGTFEVLDLHGGPVSGHYLRSDGEIIRWDVESTELSVEQDEGMRIGALVIASERLAELKLALPKRPHAAVSCENCNGHGFTDLPEAPRYLLCLNCFGLGWRAA